MAQPNAPSVMDLEASRSPSLVRLAKASGEPNKTTAGKITLKQAEEIATQKMPDLNTKDLKAAVEMVKGTARSMGIEIS